MTRLCLLGVVAVLAVSAAAQKAQKVDSDTIPDLRAFTAQVKHYKVKDATLQEAVRALVAAAGEPELAESVVVRGPEEARITLEVENETVVTILSYVSELASCYPPEISRFIHEPALVVEFNAFIVRGAMLSLMTYELSQAGARRLGWDETASPETVAAKLAACGLPLNADKGEAAWWNAKTERLAVRAYRGTAAAAGTIAFLANSGYRIVKDDP